MAIPTSINPRVTNTLTAGIVVGNINRNATRLLRVQQQLSTGREIPTISYNPSGASLTMDLQSYIEQKTQVQTNIESAQGFMAFTDDVLSQVDQLLIDARAIALDQHAVGFSRFVDPEEDPAVVAAAVLERVERGQQRRVGCERDRRGTGDLVEPRAVGGLNPPPPTHDRHRP
jgi:hypothetical protein